MHDSLLFGSPRGSNSCSDTGCVEVSGKMAEDFGVKLSLDGGGAVEKAEEVEDGKAESLGEEERDLDDGEEEEEAQEEEEEEEEEFSFCLVSPDGSPISADEIFQDGQIRPMFPVFNRDLLFAAPEGKPPLRRPIKKLFVEERDPPPSSSPVAESSGLEQAASASYCEWSRKAVAVEASPEVCKKSNSTGFSKLWRFRDLVHRSNSDGKDAFVFLSHPSSAAHGSSKQGKSKPEKNADAETAGKSSGGKVKGKGKEKKGETASSAHEKHYMRNRAKKEEDKRKSYLPYRQDLVAGFFTSVNGLSRNVHPF